MKRGLLVLALLLCASRLDAACAGSVPNLTAATWADVQACVTAAGSATTTITLASGKHSGSSKLTLNAFAENITITGEACTYDGTTNRPTSCPTIVTNDVNNDYLILVQDIPANKTYRIANIQFESGTNAFGTPFTIFDDPTDGGRFRFDHNRILSISWFPWVYLSWGRIDHNYYSGNSIQFITLHQADQPAFSNARWAADSNLGTAGGDQAVIIEDNTFTRSGGTDYALIDTWGGTRTVVRYNDIVGAIIDSHGTDTAGHGRGVRTYEAYGNNLTSISSGGIGIFVRSGPVIAFSNIYTSFSSPSAVSLNNERTLGNFTAFNQADGYSAWDDNDNGNPLVMATVSSATGSTSGSVITVQGSPGWTPDQYFSYMVHKTGCQQNGYVACAALVTANGTDTLTIGLFDANYNFTVVNNDAITLNKIEHVLDAPCRAKGTLLSTTGVAALSYSGTTATATVNGATAAGWVTGNVVNISDATTTGDFAPLLGDFSILMGVDCTPDCGTDEFQYGMATTPTGTVNSTGQATKVPWTAGANDQITEGCYQWENATNTGTNLVTTANFYTTQIRPDEHYFDYVGDTNVSGCNAEMPPNCAFDGTTGVGVGVRADRPTSCLLGTAYWSTDQGGNWNLSNAGANDGTLDKCTATNTWTNAWYTPYTYDPDSFEEAGGGGGAAGTGAGGLGRTRTRTR